MSAHRSLLSGRSGQPGTRVWSRFRKKIEVVVAAKDGYTQEIISSKVSSVQFQFSKVFPVK